MELQINAKQIKLTPESRDYILKKYARLERHLKGLSDARLEISGTSARSKDDRVVVQMTLSAGRHILRGQERGPDLYSAVDAVTDVMDRQIRRYKGKVYRTEQARKAGRAESRREMPVEAEQVSGGGDGEPRVVRTKRFSVTPMSVQDAIDQMELLSHSFFIFYNVETEEYNVVYRRRDGDYGVIETDLVGE